MHLAHFPSHSPHAAAGACSWPGTRGLVPAESEAPSAGGVLPIGSRGLISYALPWRCQKAGAVWAPSMRRWGMNLLHQCRSWGVPRGTSLSLTLNYVTDGAAASLQGLWVLLALHKEFFWTASSVMGEKCFLCSDVFRVMENVGCFCNLFMNMLQNLLCALYWVVLEVREDWFLPGNREIREKVPVMPLICESMLSTVTRHHISKQSAACLDGNSGFGVREFPLGAKKCLRSGWP